LRVLTTALPSGENRGENRGESRGEAIAEACGWRGGDWPIEIEALPGRPGHPSPMFWRAAGKRVAELRASASESDRPSVVYAVDLSGALLPRPFVLQMHGTLFSEDGA
jgi:hypothetical protein